MRRATACACTAFLASAVAACAGGGGSPPVETAAALTRVGAAVQLTESAIRARECEFVADVPSRNSNPNDAAAMTALRNDAGAAGANLVLLVMTPARTIERAEGYLCAD